MNKLSKDLSHEKTASEKQQKSNSDQLSQQISENRKLALEISKLKVLYSITEVLVNYYILYIGSTSFNK